MLRALEMKMIGTPNQDQLNDVALCLRTALEDGWWLRYYEGQYVMDAGGNDDVAFVVGQFENVNGQFCIQTWLTKWIIRPSDFKGVIKVERFNDEQVEDNAWLRYEDKLRHFVWMLGNILADDAGMPMEKRDGEIAITAAFIIDPGDSDSPEAQAERDRRVHAWSDRLSQVRGS